MKLHSLLCVATADDTTPRVTSDPRSHEKIKYSIPMELIKQQANWAKLRSKVFETPRLVQPFDKHRGIRVLPHIPRYQKRSAEVHL